MKHNLFFLYITLTTRCGSSKPCYFFFEYLFVSLYNRFFVSVYNCVLGSVWLFSILVCLDVCLFVSLYNSLLIFIGVTQVRGQSAHPGPGGDGRDLRQCDHLLLRHLWLHCSVCREHPDAGQQTVSGYLVMAWVPSRVVVCQTQIWWNDRTCFVSFLRVLIIP